MPKRTATAERLTLKQLRTAKGWKQLEVAYHLGVSLSTVANLEAGRHQPRLALAQKIAALFDVPLESIEWVRAEKKAKVKR